MTGKQSHEIDEHGNAMPDIEKLNGAKALEPIPPAAVPMEHEPSTSVVITAMNRGYSPEFVEKMMELQERYEANEARKAYAKAMAAFKANPPEILKTKHVCYTNSKNQEVKWNHAVLGEVGEAIIVGMSPHGLYHRWDMEQTDKGTIKTTCIVTHELGHSETMSMSGPPDTSGGKDALKAMSSTNTLFQRLTLLAITGLAAKGMDNENPGNDAAGAGSQKFITPEQVAKLTPDIKKYYGDGVLFLQYLQAETVETITVAQYATAVQWIKDIKAGKVKPKKQDREPGAEG